MTGWAIATPEILGVCFRGSTNLVSPLNENINGEKGKSRFLPVYPTSSKNFGEWEGRSSHPRSDNVIIPFSLSTYHLGEGGGKNVIYPQKITKTYIRYSMLTFGSNQYVAGPEGRKATKIVFGGFSTHPLPQS